MMRHNKTVRYALQFAAWCKRYDIHPHDGAELVTLAIKCHAAGVKAANGEGYDREQSTADKFTRAAHALGLRVSWSGLWPTLSDKDGRDMDILPAPPY